jgi:hypothetical protein
VKDRHNTTNVSRHIPNELSTLPRLFTQLVVIQLMTGMPRLHFSQQDEAELAAYALIPPCIDLHGPQKDPAQAISALPDLHTSSHMFVN